VIVDVEARRNPHCPERHDDRADPQIRSRDRPPEVRDGQDRGAEEEDVEIPMLRVHDPHRDVVGRLEARQPDQRREEVPTIAATHAEEHEDAQDDPRRQAYSEGEQDRGFMHGSADLHMAVRSCSPDERRGRLGR